MRKYNYKDLAAEYERLGAYNIVCEKFGCSPTTLCKAIKQYGTPKGQGGQNAKITDEQILNAVKTMTRQEIADKYGVHVENLARRMKKLGVHALKEKDGVSVFSRKGSKYHRDGDVWHFIKSGSEFVRKNTDDRFDFVAYKRGRYKIKCRKCGEVSERAKATIVYKNPQCDNCKKIEQEKRHLDELRKELCKVLSLYAELKNDKVCACCGTVFHSEIKNKKYCCEKCKNKTKGKSNYRQRARHYGVKYDNTITLAKVYKRDGGICQICGKPTDWKSNEWNGTFGANYPTVDHIKALANGGSHTWDNVQLAHAFCNSCKRDLM